MRFLVAELGITSTLGFRCVGKLYYSIILKGQRNILEKKVLGDQLWLTWMFTDENRFDGLEWSRLRSDR